jgi:hypothetical protein
MKNAIFWDVTPSISCKNRCFGGTYRFHHHGDRNQQARNNAVCLLMLVTLIMEVIRSSETSDLTGASGRNIPEGGVHHVTGGRRINCIMRFMIYYIR